MAARAGQVGQRRPSPVHDAPVVVPVQKAGDGGAHGAGPFEFVQELAQAAFGFAAEHGVRDKDRIGQVAGVVFKGKAIRAAEKDGSLGGVERRKQRAEDEAGQAVVVVDAAADQGKGPGVAAGVAQPRLDVVAVRLEETAHERFVEPDDIAFPGTFFLRSGERVEDLIEIEDRNLPTGLLDDARHQGEGIRNAGDRPAGCVEQEKTRVGQGVLPRSAQRNRARPGRAAAGAWFAFLSVLQSYP